MDCCATSHIVNAKDSEMGIWGVGGLSAVTSVSRSMKVNVEQNVTIGIVKADRDFTR